MRKTTMMNEDWEAGIADGIEREYTRNGDRRYELTEK
jgi:hypothetical protein